MITEERAVELVEALLARMRRESPWMARLPELAVVAVEEHAFGWLVFWQSVEYIRTRDIGAMLAGNGPFLVDRQDGSIHSIAAVGFGDGGWEEHYLREIKGVRPPEAADPLLAAVRALVQSDGTMAAIRHVRRQTPLLGPQQAKAYVTAVRDGGDPPEELAVLIPKPAARPSPQIETLAGPVQ
ncbi:YrhB domain-containing protein [Kitasatospora cinereorecta]|uniref:YrhB domain-containing protein n=1 Tax=Kitasatospora cinereorecta TaxID=285560 RepID=A0ABW0VBI7_9ACTN